MELKPIYLSNENIAFLKSVIINNKTLVKEAKELCLYVLTKKSLENATTDEQREIVLRDDFQSNPSCFNYEAPEDIGVGKDVVIHVVNMVEDEFKEAYFYSVIKNAFENATTDEQREKILKFYIVTSPTFYFNGEINYFELSLLFTIALTVLNERVNPIIREYIKMCSVQQLVLIEDPEFVEKIAPTNSVEFYENLIEIDNIKQRQLLGYLEVNSSTFDTLYKFLNKRDKAGFLESLADVEITRVSKLTKVCHRIIHMYDGKSRLILEEYYNFFDHKRSDLEDRNPEDLSAIEEKTLRENDVVSMVNRLNMSKRFMKEILETEDLTPALKRKLYNISYHLSPILESFSTNFNVNLSALLPWLINLDLLINDDATEEAEEKQQVLDGNSFKLPKNFFDLAPSPNTEEFFGCADFLLPGNDVKKFESLINYIAEAGHIENSIATKRLLVFRLTGRWRPEGDLPKIKWYDENSLGLTISYLIVRGYDKSKNKYQKMKDFFEGPQWLDNDKIAKRAAGASTSFRRELNALYPKYFTLKSGETPNSKL